MLLRSITKHVKDQNWFAVFLDFFIVVAGILIAFQVNNWNEARADERRKTQIVNALITDLRDTSDVHEIFINRINAGIENWKAEYAQGLKPTPFYYRVEGSDTAPNTWRMIEQMQLSDLFDPVTLFDLSFYYSERRGVGVKYLRYIKFVEDKMLPIERAGSAKFYDEDAGEIKPEFAANMDRLEDYRNELARLKLWEDCLVFRLESQEKHEDKCLRAEFILDGVKPKELESE